MKSGSIVLLEKEISIEQEGDEKKRAQKKKPAIATLPLVTYEPVGNPLGKMSEGQRRFFLDSILRASRPVRAQPRARQAGADAQAKALAFSVQYLAGRIAQAARASDLETQKAKAAGEQARRSMEEGRVAQGQARQQAATASERQEQQPPEKKPLLEKESAVVPLSESALAGASSTISKLLPSTGFTGNFKSAQDALAFVLADFARGDEKKLRAAFDEFESRVSAPQHKSVDLMATLLLVVEDLAWEGEEGAAGSPAHFGARVKKPLAVPETLRENARESALVRLASVREMLRYYIERNPKEYPSILASALGLVSDSELDQQFLQERLASELANIGGFALAQKMLAEVKKKFKKDTNKCLITLGYRYDRKNKVLVVGKRTCGTPNEAKGIIALLLASAKKGDDD